MKRYDIYISYWIRKRRLSVIALLILVSSGVIVTSIGIIFYSDANPPTFSSNPYYQGLGIAENSTVTPFMIDIGLQVSPAEFSFQYFYNTQTNGTYYFVLEFPFKITNAIPTYSLSGKILTENMTVNSTDTCSVVTVTQNVNSTHFISGEIWGNFNIAPTFLSENRGLYTIVLPFGNPYNNEVFANITGGLAVSPFTPATQLQINIILPHLSTWTESFPSITGTKPSIYPPTSKPTTSLYWDFNNLQNLTDSITVLYENQSQIGNYANWNFLSGIFIGIGTSILVTTFYDVLKRWSEKPENFSLHS